VTEGTAEGFVRGARASDAPALARIQVASWQSTLSGLVPSEVLSSLSGEDAVAGFSSRWQQAIASPPSSRHKVLVAYPAGSAGEPVGFASIGPATDEDRWPGTDGELYELHVLPDQAASGHGGRLLHAVADTLADDGFRTALAWTLAGDSARVEFLKAAGWAPDGSQGNLDMGIKVPVIRLHTLLAEGTLP
jgi:GNAT superfamily N-acetyltransferase